MFKRFGAWTPHASSISHSNAPTSFDPASPTFPNLNCAIIAMRWAIDSLSHSWHVMPTLRSQLRASACSGVGCATTNGVDTWRYAGCFTGCCHQPPSVFDCPAGLVVPPPNTSFATMPATKLPSPTSRSSVERSTTAQVCQSSSRRAIFAAVRVYHVAAVPARLAAVPAETRVVLSVKTPLAPF